MPSDIVFSPIPTTIARQIQAGGADHYGAAPDRAISDGDGIPCRHCLSQIPKGRPYLILAYRPFEGLHPYTETGPIFLCADAESCPASKPSSRLPEIFNSQRYLIRGYDARECIVYGTGQITETATLLEDAADLLDRPNVSFVHVRSARNNCFQVRIDRNSAQGI